MISLTPNSERRVPDGPAPRAPALSANALSTGGELAAGSFNKLLSAQQQLLTTTLHGDDKTSANLMFEPPPSEKDSTHQATQAKPAEQEENSSPRTHSKAQRSVQKSQPRKDSVFDSIDAHVQNVTTSTPATGNRELGFAGEQGPNSTANGAAQKFIEQRVSIRDASSSSAQDRGTSNSYLPTNEIQSSAGIEAGGTGRTSNATTMASTNPTEIHSTGESENETNPAHQIGRFLAAANSSDTQAAAGERHEIQSPVAQDFRSTLQSQQAERSETSRAPSADSTTKSNSTESTPATPFEQLVQSLRLRVGSKVSSAVMQLHPPQLGKMKIDVRAIGDQIKVSVETETQAARDRVNEHASELRAALAQHGIDVRQFDVTVSAPIGNADSYFAQGWGRSSDADHRESESSMNQRSGGPSVMNAASDSIVTGFSAVGTTRLDVRV